MGTKKKPLSSRARITNGTRLLPTVDGRTTWGRIMSDTYAAMLEHCGGEDFVSEPKRMASRRAAVLETELCFMVKRATPEVINLHGGLSLQVDTNDVRLAKDAIATIILDAEAAKPIGHVWREAGESQEEAAVRAGYTVEQIPQLLFIRWLTSEEAKVAPPVAHPLDRADEPGPPQDDAGQTVSRQRAGGEAGVTPAAPSPDPDHALRLAEAERRYQEGVAQLERERVNERLAIANRAFARSIA